MYMAVLLGSFEKIVTTAGSRPAQCSAGWLNSFDSFKLLESCAFEKEGDTDHLNVFDRLLMVMESIVVMFRRISISQIVWETLP